uniref:hypothetical protein n=1 Tax=Penaeicola halotolerans TaxID=2793196 RepID=UPI001CF831D4
MTISNLSERKKKRKLKTGHDHRKYSKESYTPKRKTNTFMGSQGRTNHTRTVNKKERIKKKSA